MKKKILIALGAAGVIAASITFGAYAASDIKLLINGKTIDADVQVIDGTSYVPLRVVSESLGAQVNWDGDTRSVSITTGASANQEPSPVKPDPEPELVSVTAENRLGSPTNFNYKVNTADGVKLTWVAKNLTNKTIKYYTLKISTYNAVGDPSYDDMSRKSKFSQRYVGPVKPGETLVFYDLFTYQQALSTITIDEIVLEYMDGTKETIQYGLSTSDDSGL